MAYTRRGKGAEWRLNRGAAQAKRINRTLAHAVRDRPEFKAAATKIYGEVLAEAAKHYHTGNFEKSIRLRQGRVDWSIETTGVGYSWHTEFGHYAGPSDLGNKRTWVEGIGVFRNVVNRNGGF